MAGSPAASGCSHTSYCCSTVALNMVTSIAKSAPSSNSGSSFDIKCENLTRGNLYRLQEPGRKVFSSPATSSVRADVQASVCCPSLSHWHGSVTSAPLSLRIRRSKYVYLTMSPGSIAREACRLSRFCGLAGGDGGGVGGATLPPSSPKPFTMCPKRVQAGEFLWGSRFLIIILWDLQINQEFQSDTPVNFCH